MGAVMLKANKNVLSALCSNSASQSKVEKIKARRTGLFKLVQIITRCLIRHYKRKIFFCVIEANILNHLANHFSVVRH